MCPVCLLVSVRWCSCWCSVLAVVSEVSVRCVFAVGLSCCMARGGGEEGGTAGQWGGIRMCGHAELSCDHHL